MERKTLIPNIQELQLANVTPSIQEYFHQLMVELDTKTMMGGLLIVNEENELGFGVAGVFSKFEAADCILIPNNQASYNADTHTLYLTDMGISTLVHEGNHFRHLVVDKGEWRSGTCKKKHTAPADIRDRSCIFDFEYEAGWRSLQDAIMYFGDRPDLVNVIIGAQVINLQSYRSDSIDIVKRMAPLQQILDEHSSRKNAHLLKKLADQLIYKACGEYMLERQFSELADIENFNMDATDHDKVLIALLTQTIV